MAAKKPAAKKPAITGNLKFGKLDLRMATFTIQEKVGKDGALLVGPGALQVTKDLFPADFELAHYDVEASFQVFIDVKKKK